MNLNEKLHRVRYRVNSGRPHIRLNAEVCSDCLEKTCLYICPVDNFSLEDGKVVFKWEDCVECGACRIACTRGSLEWDYPDGSYGISYRCG